MHGEGSGRPVGKGGHVVHREMPKAILEVGGWVIKVDEALRDDLSIARLLVLILSAGKGLAKLTEGGYACYASGLGHAILSN